MHTWVCYVHGDRLNEGNGHLFEGGGYPLVFSGEGKGRLAVWRQSGQ